MHSVPSSQMQRSLKINDPDKPPTYFNGSNRKKCRMNLENNIKVFADSKDNLNKRAAS